MTKRIITIFAALLITMALTLTSFAENAGFAIEKERALPVKTPFDKSRVEILWNTDYGENVGVPIPDGEFVILPTMNTVRKLGESDGKLAEVAVFDEKVSTEHSGAMMRGILVQPARTMLYAVETENMTVLCSRQFGEIVTDVALLNDLAFFGAETSDNEYAFYGAEYKHDFKTVWEYKCKAPPTSPALYGDMVVFGADDKLIVHRSDSPEYKENPVGAELTNVFAGRYSIFMTSSDGNVCKLRLLSDGSAEEDTLESCAVGKISPRPRNTTTAYTSAPQTDSSFLTD